MTLPIIGITSYALRAAFGVWETETALVPQVYVHAIDRAGGRPLVVPPSLEGIEETLDVLDGIVFSGGEDIEPGHYGAEPHPETTNVNKPRDRAELALLRAALERDMPVLAVCRGSQILNVALGGDLVQHLPDVVGDEKHKHTPGVFADHDVTLKSGSRLSHLLGERAPVKSHHHQGYGKLGSGLEPVAWAEDGTIEGLEEPSKRYTLGVLWHPEESDDIALFEGLVREAREYRARR